jgi:hypothetical protein
MPRTGLPLLLGILAACSTDARRSSPTAPYTIALHASAAPTAGGCLLDPSDCPPQAWIDSPAELAPDFPQANSNCDFTMFGLAATIPQWDYRPTAACQQRQWGNSGIYRQQARDIYVTSLPKLCGGPGDIDEIRLCSLAWKSRPTPFGLAGSAGCVVVKLETTCGA